MKPISAPSLSPFLSSAVWSLYRIRRLGHVFGDAQQLATNATFFGGLIGGLLLSCFCGENRTVKLTGRIVMIASRAVAAVKVEIALAESAFALKEICSINTLLPPPEQISLQRWSWLSVSTCERMSHMLNRILSLIKEFLTELVTLLSLLIEFSSYLIDLARAIQGEEEALDQGVRELCINCVSCVGESLELVDELLRYEVKIHHIMRFLGATHECELIAAKAMEGCNSVMATVSYPFITMGRGLQRVIGVEESIPTSLISTGREFWIYDKLFPIKPLKR